jgi:hypothetical protein
MYTPFTMINYIVFMPLSRYVYHQRQLTRHDILDLFLAPPEPPLATYHVLMMPWIAEKFPWIPDHRSC